MVNDKENWAEVGKRRIYSILSRHVIASMRILEMKICDAGPFDQRPNPHILTKARDIMLKDGDLLQKEVSSGDGWYYLPGTPQDTLTSRFNLLNSIAKKHHATHQRTGNCLEIAVFKALQQQTKLDFQGHFIDDYSKKIEHPDRLGNRELNKGKLDFIITLPDRCAIEVKNRREWIYPDNNKYIRDLLRKATELDAIPVLIARRIPYVTFMLLKQCGCVFHQTYNQLMDERDRVIAEKAKDKSLLGYHDIRIGSEPDKRLLKFITINLSDVLPSAREKFDEHKDLLASYASGHIRYQDLVNTLRLKRKNSTD